MFADASVNGASLQCAYLMLVRDYDKNYLKKLACILKPGGKVIIGSLYMHTHSCAYATPEYSEKGKSDVLSKEYVL
jgi:hypothetical protein